MNRTNGNAVQAVKIWRSAIILTVLAALCPAQTQQSIPRPPNIVFILIDDLRWDELGCAGHPFI